MMFFTVLFLVNVIASLVAFIREPKEDPRFEGDKLIYRS